MRAIIILLFIILLIYSNYPSPAPSQPMWDSITFNPFRMPAECPEKCSKYSPSEFEDSILVDSTQKKFCGIKKQNMVYPCPSKCCL